MAASRKPQSDMCARDILRVCVVITNSGSKLSTLIIVLAGQEIWKLFVRWFDRAV